jgi:recombination protein RecT
LIELAQASGKVEFITSDIVYENDFFEVEKTMDGDTYRFKPALAERGKALGYFAALKMTKYAGGSVHVKWIDRANMEAHRDRYAQGLKDSGNKPKPNHAWNKSFDGMALKTVLKALLRSLEISPELTSAVVSDDRFEAGEQDTDGIPSAVSAEDVKAAMEVEENEDETTEEKQEASSGDGADLF